MVGCSRRRPRGASVAGKLSLVVGQIAKTAAGRGRKSKGRVLFAGHAYYNTWYLSRELRKLGWKADVLNWDPDPGNDLYYHGEDFRLRYGTRFDALRHFGSYLATLPRYDIFHFSNAHGMQFGRPLQQAIGRVAGKGAEIKLLKKLGKRIVYTNNGCLDGVSQTSFSSWGEEPVCDLCPWRHEPTICSDQRNLAWGKFRNAMADYQVLLGGNHIDYNLDPRVHEVPEFYCLDPEVWSPDLEIPEAYRLPKREGLIRIFHTVGNMDERTDPTTGRNIKSTHVWLPLIETLKAEGYEVELLSPRSIPNKVMRYYQLQADIIGDMLGYGWFGAMAREGLMLGRPVVCWLRPEWLEQMKPQIPEYVAELPVISATPDTVYETVVKLIEDREHREEVGRRGREFAVKWHSAAAGARRFDRIYSDLLESAH